MKIIKWTFWGDPKYPEVEWEGKEAERPYEEAIVEAIRKHGYRFCGQAHQNARFAVPVFENGRQYNVSMRHWGGLMAEAIGLEGEYAYALWAWYPAEEPSVFPDPSEWGETSEELAAQEGRMIQWEKKRAAQAREDAKVLAAYLKEKRKKESHDSCD